MSSQSVAVLVRSHLTGQAPAHKRLPPRPDSVKVPSERSIEIADVELDVGYYDRGITAQREAHTQLTDVTDILDGVEGEADKLLGDLLSLLDGVGLKP